MTVRVEHAVLPGQWYTPRQPDPSTLSLDDIEKHVHGARAIAARRQQKSWFRIRFDDDITQAAYDARHPENVIEGDTL